MKAQIRFLQVLTVLGLASAVAMVFTPQQRVDHVLGLIGLVCLLVGTFDPQKWRFLALTPGQLFQRYRAGERPLIRAPWREALNVLGMGLLGLALWRSWSGL